MRATGQRLAVAQLYSALKIASCPSYSDNYPKVSYWLPCSVMTPSARGSMASASLAFPRLSGSLMIRASPGVQVVGQGGHVHLFLGLGDGKAGGAITAVKGFV